jgi:hypothetical protein
MVSLSDEKMKAAAGGQSPFALAAASPETYHKATSVTRL